MSTTWRGDSLTELPMTSTWKIGVGGRTIRTYKGKEADITNKATELQLAGWETEISTGPVWTLVATYNVDLITDPGGEGGNEPEPEPVWELIPHSVQQSIYDCGRDFVASLPSNVKQSIEAKLKNPQNPKVFVVPPTIANTTWINNALRIYVYKQLGVDARQIYTLSLKRSIIVSNQFNLNWSVDATNMVLSSGRIISRYGPPTQITRILPPTFWQSETITVDNADAGYVSYPGTNPVVQVPSYWGWLEQHPSYQTVSNNRIQIAQEWVYGKYIAGPNGGLYDVLE